MGFWGLLKIGSWAHLGSNGFVGQLNQSHSPQADVYTYIDSIESIIDFANDEFLVKIFAS